MRVRGLPYPVMGMGSPLSLARAKGGGGDPVLAAFADGTDGFYFDFSKTDRLFQDIVDTPSDDAGENIGLALEQHSWAGRSLASILASAANLAPASSSISGFTLVNCTLAVVSGEIELTATATGVTFADVDVPVTNGQFYRWEATMRRGQAAGAAYISPAYGAVPYSTAVQQETNKAAAIYKRASGTSTEILRLRFDATVIGQKAYFSGFKCQAVPGNYGLQASASFQPKWQTGGLARFDGLDDNLLTTLNPAASFSMAFKGKVTSASKVVMGSRSTTDTRVLIGTDASGLLAGGVGADSTSTIKGGSDIRGTTGVGALVFDASTVTLYWNGASIYSGALNGSPNTTIALRLGAFNDNGTGGSFADADVYHALAIKKALTAGQIAAITNKWGTS